VPAAARVELPPGVKVDLVPNGGANLTDSTAALDEVTKLVQGMPWSTVSYDVSTQRITIEAGTALRTRVQDALSDYRGSVPVDVKYSDQDIEVDFQVNVRGGGYFNGPGAACTTGFSVIYYQGGVGTRGTATAAHCRLFVGGAWNYNDPSASGSVGTTRAGYGFGTGWGDLEVATTPGDELPAFYSNGAGSIMPVSNWGAPPAGTVICVNGRATGKHCAPIINPEFAYNTGGYSFTRMVKTPNPNTADGDSGAPWFYGSKAVGIHSAVALINGVYYGIASNVTYLSNTTGLNAVILTQ
jgi:hypothetical protein